MTLSIAALWQGFTQILSTGVDWFSGALFFPLGGQLPIIVLWLLLGIVFSSFRMGFINLRGFGHAFAILRGKYEGEEEQDEGEVSHWQALTTALSGTVGLGNIAGVAIAIQMGGPGAILWMVVGGFLSMNCKFVECTLGQKYRTINPDGTVIGGPMCYLKTGLANLGYGRLGSGLSQIFCLCCIGSSLGASSMFQVNQSYGAIAHVIPIPNWLYGLVLVVLTAIVIVGGVRRIAQVTSRLVPLMCGLYVMGSVAVLIHDAAAIPHALQTILEGALHPAAGIGGVIAVMAQGLRRAAFASEAGLGIASIAHAATRTNEPVREGLVAMLEPTADAGLICTLTGLVLITTGVYQDPSLANLNGSGLTAIAFEQVISWFPIVLALAVLCFAFSTIISVTYYAESSWRYLWGDTTIIYKILLLSSVFLGSIVNPETVINFSDSLFLLMSFPNLLGLYFLSNTVATDLKGYTDRYGLSW
ncbi:MAG: hypothetical protein RLZZ435_1696 [Cyanobacteriota bacterium]|jgi:AGCS family alanine or glycine:cation symporter